MTIKISVIIPTFNRGQTTLLAAINSALNQTYKPFEIIVCDDGSTDNTKNILDLNYTSNQIRYIYCGKNGRPSIPRNIGIKKAKGNWIAFLDSDDIWLQNKLETQVNFVKINKLSVICSNSNTGENQLYFRKNISNINLSILLKYNPIITSTVLIKKKEIERANYFPEKFIFKGIEDYLLWFKVCINQDFFYQDISLSVYSKSSFDRISYSTKIIIIFKYFITINFFIYILIINRRLPIVLKLFKIIFDKFVDNLKRIMGKNGCKDLPLK